MTVDDPAARLFAQAIEAQMAGRQRDAVAAYCQVLAIAPAHFTALSNLGALLASDGQLELAIQCYRQALAARPDVPEAHRNLARALGRQGTTDEARAHFAAALDLRPDWLDCRIELCEALLTLGNVPEAMAHARGTPTATTPPKVAGYTAVGAGIPLAKHNEAQAADVHFALGQLALQAGNALAAIPLLEKACQERPDASLPTTLLADTLAQIGETEAASKAYARAISYGAGPGTAIKLATVLPVVAESSDAAHEAFHRFVTNVDTLLASGLQLSDPVREVGLTHFLLAYGGEDLRPVLETLARFYIQACPSLTWDGIGTERGPTTGRVRVGFVSRCLSGDHILGRMLKHVFAGLDRQAFEVVAYHLGDIPTGPMALGADRAIGLLGDLPAIRQSIAADKPDVLLYTDIGGDPLSYFLAFARLAPVQCVVGGYPVTTGIPNVDYFLSTIDSEIETGAEAHYSEQLVRLGGWTLTLPKSELTVAADRDFFGLEADWTLYVCPSMLYKMHPDFDPLLAEILRQDPTGRVILIEGPQPHWAKLLRERLTRTMPDVVDRVVFLQGHLPFQSFLALVKVADVVLDPLFYGGGSTPFFCFGPGTPIVTLPGPFLRSRGTDALYRRMGITEPVAETAEEYVALSLRLAKDRTWRAQLVGRIESRQDALYDAEAGVRDFARFLTEVTTAR